MKITLSKSQWKNIGLKTGWLKTSQNNVTCKKCNQPFNYSNAPETSMGSVQCPNCKTTINQNGEILASKTYNLFKIANDAQSDENNIRWLINTKAKDNMPLADALSRLLVSLHPNEYFAPNIGEQYDRRMHSSDDQGGNIIQFVVSPGKGQIGKSYGDKDNIVTPARVRTINNFKGEIKSTQPDPNKMTEAKQLYDNILANPIPTCPSCNRKLREEQVAYINKNKECPMCGQKTDPQPTQPQQTQQTQPQQTQPQQTQPDNPVTAITCPNCKTQFWTKPMIDFINKEGYCPKCRTKNKPTTNQPNQPNPIAYNIHNLKRTAYHIFHTPRYQETCPNCIFLGGLNEFDLYFCVKNNSFSARFGNQPDSYLNQFKMQEYKRVKKLPLLDTAKQLKQEQGIS